MRRTFTFLLRPTGQQVASLTAMLTDHRSLYNAALQERRDAYRHPSKTTVRYGDQSAQLTEIRSYDPDQNRWSFSSQQATLRRLDKAFQAFFRRVKAGEAPGYPRFKGAGRFDTVTWPSDGDGCRWDSQPENPITTFVRLRGVGHVKVHQYRPVLGRVKTISVKRAGNRWYVLLSCDDVPAEPLPATGAMVGVDMGTVSFLTTSDGRHEPNPKHLATSADRLASAQRNLARRKRGSKRRREAAAHVASIYRQIGRQRLDHAHQTAHALVRDHDLIAHEQVRPKNMTRRAAPRPDPDKPGAFLPNGQAAKSGLNKSILDAGWGVFLGILAAKAESAGRTVIPVPAPYTSQTCHACGQVAAANRASQAEFRCTACGHRDHADVNAARNILRAGLALQADAQAA